VDAGGNHLRMFAVYADSTAVYLERRKHLITSPVSGLYILKNGGKCGIIM